ncbi:MAG TPA: hypothetical protein VL334_20675 [Anaerolineae bacterium]|nr:hypothetical protein [Anaerolineae bacterium]
MNSDFRDRISIAVWGVAITLAASALVSLPGRGASVALGEQTLTLPIAAANLLPLLLALLAGAGAQAVVQAHPLARQGRLRLPIRFWALPIAVTLIAAILLPRAPSVVYWAALLLAMAALLSAVLVALYFSLDSEATGYRRARAVLNLVCYAVALVLFLLIPSTWPEAGRAIVLGGVASLLALELLRGTQARASSVALYAFIVGAVVAQVAFGLLLTSLSSLSASLLLLVLFYLLVSLTAQTLLDRLTRRIVLEFAAVGLAALLVILVLSP